MKETRQEVESYRKRLVEAIGADEDSDIAALGARYLEAVEKLRNAVVVSTLKVEPKVSDPKREKPDRVAAGFSLTSTR